MRKASTAIAIVLVFCSITRAQITVPGADGSDGVFAPMEDTVVDLSLAINRAWDEPSPSEGRGIYDHEKWAVVFKYESVNIPSDVEVTFRNHPANAPVVWLVSGDVTINGVIRLDGGNGTTANPASITVPGPGGFRGGKKALAHSAAGAGFGPGGGPNTNVAGCYSECYGDAAVVPLVGGSGGAGGHNTIGSKKHTSGGAGGGAIMIASPATIEVNGWILTSGGMGPDLYLGVRGGGGGSGGAIRLIADRVTGNGALRAIGGAGAWVGDPGRIRIEANDVASFSDPGDPLASIDFPAEPVLLWPPESAPSARITSVDGIAVPTDPHAQFRFPVTDVSVATDEEVSIIIEAENVPASSSVTLRLVPTAGPDQRIAATCISGDDPCSTWEVATALPALFSALQVLVELP